MDNETPAWLKSEDNGEIINVDELKKKQTSRKEKKKARASRKKEEIQSDSDSDSDSNSEDEENFMIQFIGGDAAKKRNSKSKMERITTESAVDKATREMSAKYRKEQNILKEKKKKKCTT